MEGYQGLLFPARAEDLRQQLFKSYRVFLEYWDSLSEKLRFRYEELAVSRRTTAVVIYGAQGTGKTLLADKLKQGLERARSDESSPGDATNLWHRLTGGSRLDPALIREATKLTHLIHIEDDPKWVETCEKWFEGRTSNEHCIIVADNAERGYFLQGLLNLDDAAFLQLGRTDEAYRVAAERFVALARTKIRPAMFLFLTNSEEFALNFSARVNAQHVDLVHLEALPLPSDRDKETAVRVNTNLLNRVTYWFCLDRAGPDGKQNVLRAIRGNETFPGSFSAVNSALANADRVGRPANKCVLTLALFTDADALPPTAFGTLGGTSDKHSWSSTHLRVEFFHERWATQLISQDRQARLLESEWSLRVVTISNRLLASLLDASARPLFSTILQNLATIHGVGTHAQTMADHWRSLGASVDATPSTWDAAAVAQFWAKGQVRSADYEGALRTIRPSYNRTDVGFLSYRPDLVVEPYRVCTVLNAISDSREAINEAIKRNAHVFEFTASKAYSSESALTYLKTKLPNYVAILEQQ